MAEMCFPIMSARLLKGFDCACVASEGEKVKLPARRHAPAKETACQIFQTFSKRRSHALLGRS